MEQKQELQTSEYEKIRDSLSEELGNSGEDLMRQLNKAEVWGFRVAECKAHKKKQLDLERHQYLMPAGQKGVNGKALTDLDRNISLAALTAPTQMQYDLLSEVLERIDKRISACQSQLSMYKQEMKSLA